MKKTILATLAAAALLSAVALVGCNNDKHSHSYGDWQSDGDQHWHECECGNKKDEDDHHDDVINETGEAGQDEKCDQCGRDLHEHVFNWKSDADGHWQECDCGEQMTSKVDHVDKKNNDTDEAGADEKCDVCGRGYFAVTFNMDGHGTVPETQYIGKDGKVEQPETPADDDSFKFKGWYKDAQHTTPFDFDTDTVTAATQIYAWFEDDTTPGASKNHAYALELDQGNPQKAKKNEVVYYSFKASKDGRYTISLGMGTNNENATFTTSVTGETTYGKDCASSEVTVDVDNKQTVYIFFTFLGEEGDDVVVSPIVTEVTNEPMPADYFIKGEYYNGTSVIEITDRTDAAHQTLLFNDTPYTFRYIGGKYNRIYFTQVSTSAGIHDTTYYLSYYNGSYSFYSNQNGSRSTYEYAEPQDPVALSEILGYYEPVGAVGGGSESEEGEGTITPKPSESDRDTSNTRGGILGLYIYDTDSTNSATVRYKFKADSTVSYSDLITASYNTEKNRLVINATYTATLKLSDSGDVEALLIGGVTYVRKSTAGAVPPEKLGLDDESEYNGETYKIRTQYGSEYFGATGNDAIYVLGYAEDTKVYTVDVIKGITSNAYKIKVSEDKTTVELYAEDGTTKLDTLTKYVYVASFGDIPADVKVTSLTSEDFYHHFAYFKAKTAGWYKFTDISAGLRLYANIDEEELENYEKGDMIVAGTAIYLEEDSIVAAYLISGSDGISFKSETTEAPVGSSEENPIGCAETTTVSGVNNKDYYYVEFTAPKEGTYAISAYYDEGYINYIRYNVDGEDYGRHDYEWIGGCSFKQPCAIIEVTEGQKVLIKIDRIGEMSSEPIDVTVDIAEYVGEDDKEDEEATTVTVYGGLVTYDDGSGFTMDSSVTLVLNGLKGVYSVNGNPYDVELSINSMTGKCAFSYDMDGEYQTVTLEVNDGSLVINDSFNGDGTIAQLPQGTFGGLVTYDDGSGFTMDSSVTLTLNGLKGVYSVNGNPYDVELSINSMTGKCTFSYDMDGEYQTVTLEVNDGSLVINDSFNGDGTIAQLPQGTFGGLVTYDDGSGFTMDSSVTLTLNGLKGVYTVNGNPYDVELSINSMTGKCTFSYDMDGEYQTVTLEVNDGELVIVDSFNGDGTIAQLPQGTFGGLVTYDDGSGFTMDSSVTLTLNGLKGVYTVNGNPYDVELTVDMMTGDCKFSYDMDGEYQTVTLGFGAGALTIADSFNGDGTVTQLPQGTFGGLVTYDDGTGFTLDSTVTLTLNGLKGVYTVNGNPYDVELTVDMMTGDCKFSYDMDGEYQTVTLEVNDGELAIADSFNGDGTIKQLP